MAGGFRIRKLLSKPERRFFIYSDSGLLARACKIGKHFLYLSFHFFVRAMAALCIVCWEHATDYAKLYEK